MSCLLSTVRWRSTQYIGGESRTDGLQINWLVPVAHYVSLTVGAGNQFGGDNPPNNVGDFRQRQRIELLGPLVHIFRPDPRYLTRTRHFGPVESETDAQWADPAALILHFQP